MPRQCEGTVANAPFLHQPMLCRCCEMPHLSSSTELIAAVANRSPARPKVLTAYSKSDPKLGSGNGQRSLRINPLTFKRGGEKSSPFWVLVSAPIKSDSLARNDQWLMSSSSFFVVTPRQSLP